MVGLRREAALPSLGSGCAPEPLDRRLLWRCRRGMKELDMLLEPYARELLLSGSAEELSGLAELLALPDPLLAAYLLGEGTPGTPHLVQHVSRIKALCRRGP
jgi:antitoxin CptB